MRRIKPVLFVLALFVAGFAIAYALVLAGGSPAGRDKPLIGGPFTLTDSQGKHVTDRDFRGKLMLVFFGYTNCPDVCPTELQNMTDVLGKLGPAAAQVAPIFVSVDPERDTPAQLDSYVKSFDPRIVGLTGTASEVASAAKAYRVYFRKAAGGADSYTVDHSAFVYLMDREGNYLTHFLFNTSPDAMSQEIKKHLDDGSKS